MEEKVKDKMFVASMPHISEQKKEAIISILKEKNVRFIVETFCVRAIVSFEDLMALKDAGAEINRLRLMK